MLQYDEQLFYWINGHYSSVADPVLWVFSQPWSWLPVLVAAYGYLLWRCHRQGGGLQHHWWLLLVGVALCFLLSDQISVHLFKNVFHRLRPCHALEGVRMYRTGCGGRYGFVSSHAANAFAVALFMGLYCRRHTSGRGRNVLLWVLLLWGTVVGYSRPYLGKHYPGDVLCGALLGLVVGAAVYAIVAAILRRTSSKDSA